MFNSTVCGYTEPMQVFLSHSSKDKDLIRKITDELKRSGMEVWDDSIEVLPGDNWAQLTSQALEASQAMVVLLTPETIDSKWIRWDIQFALGNISYKHRLIPVLIGDPSRFPKERIPGIFKHLNVINLPDHGKNDENIKQIAVAIKQAA
ncbi:MAG TPA: toll/interleukin-1 receptor domain-containing protein [Pyrinomonadaceae bacterium]|nr:toll/interleukin-1 receptor domain-containing protein [Pyrinomonadaceae bacterium]